MTEASSSPRRRLVPESELPPRYQDPWRPGFVVEVLVHCPPGVTILDVGGGDAPTLPRDARPDDATYIGLDPDSDDLAAGDYDRRILASATDLQEDLVGNVDLVVSWNVLEHVTDMPIALARFRDYLKPGGVFLSRFAGRWAVFAVASRAMPHRLRVQLLSRLIGSAEEDHFPTVYDRCTYRDFEVMLADWAEHEITPYYRAAGYLAFSRPLQRAYLAYESLAMHHTQLATHYNVRAVR